MKIDIDNLDSTYRLCEISGKFRITNEIDMELVKSKKLVSELGLAFIMEKAKGISRDSPDWTFVFRDYYEALRGLMEALLLFDRIVSDNHQCMNSYICINHPEMGLDWEFLEIARLRRNRINYRGQLVSYDEWHGLKLKFELHIAAIVRAIDAKIKDK
ncbi:MAG: hypothetical protein PHO02_04885 [Candidatus Nanoarchaeia archaeon]|nr:hypothetical protein [Candidatus Nanoarchaeia archaeon]